MRKMAVLILAGGVLALSGCDHVEGRARDYVARAKDQVPPATQSDEKVSERQWRTLWAATACRVYLIHQYDEDETAASQDRFLDISYNTMKRIIQDDTTDALLFKDRSADFAIGYFLSAWTEEIRKEFTQEAYQHPYDSDEPLRREKLLAATRYHEANCALVGG